MTDYYKIYTVERPDKKWTCIVVENVGKKRFASGSATRTENFAEEASMRNTRRKLAEGGENFARQWFDTLEDAVDSIIRIG